MSFVIRNNLAGISGMASRKKTSVPTEKFSIGKVYGIVLNENTPSKEAFEAVGGWNGIGTIFYKEYEASKDEDVNKFDVSNILLECTPAKPLDFTNQIYPLLGEIVYIISAPSPVSEISNTAGAKYYSNIINIYNNVEQNSNTKILGNTFIRENKSRRLLAFEGDTIITGRKGNGIRFGSTVKFQSTENEWSSIGNNGDPITILVNGYATPNTGSLIPNIEEINKEMSSIYMTSTQKLPLTPGALINNPVFKILSPENYINSQIILNSDRVTLNSKKDEILLFAKTNIGLNTDNNIILNAGKNVHINIESKNPDSKILLGTKTDGSAPDEPVLLGGQTHDLLLEICNTLQQLAGYLASASAVTSDGSLPIPSINDGGTQLFNDVSNLIDRLETIQSNKVFTV